MSFAVTHFAWHLAFLRQFTYARKDMIALYTQTCQQCCFTSAVLNSSPPVEVHFVQDVNLNCIYLQRYMMSHSSVREDVAQRKSKNECSEIK